MKNTVDFEEYKNGRKTYLVFPYKEADEDTIKAAMKRFHCTADHIYIQYGYTEDGYLYLAALPKEMKQIILTYER
ncbi:MAG: hypothetical protein IKZ94_02630 [Lachnospiraceae bacterium]|nr:hypothetical protein [Lachnospiraceae bacterium]